MKTRKKEDRETVYHRISRNNAKQCDCKDCYRSRFALSKYCRVHHYRYVTYGSPDGRRIPPNEYSHEEQLVTDFLKKHVDHPAIKSAVAWFTTWLTDARDKKPVTGSSEFYWLYSKGVEGIDCLKRVLSIWLYAHNHPHRLPGDVRLDYALSNAVTGLVSRPPVGTHYVGKEKRYTYREVSIVDRREIGVRIRRTLFNLCENAVRGIEKELDKEYQMTVNLSKPFDAEETN